MHYGVNGQNSPIVVRALPFLALLLCYLQGSAAFGQDLAEIRKRLQAGDFRGAKYELQKLSVRTPTDSEVWNLLGATHAQLGEFSAAEGDFQRAARLQPKSVSILLNLARVYHAQSNVPGYVEKALQTFATVLQLDPQNAEAHHQSALLLQWQGHFAESLRHLDKLPPEDQERRAALVIRCADEAALGSAHAQVTAGKLLADPQLEEGDVRVILPVLEQHNQSVAIRLLSALAARQQASPETLDTLAALQAKQHNYQAARKTLEQRYSPAPTPDGLLQLARLAWEQKDFEGTLSYLAHARGLSPNDARIHFLFGLAANELKLPAEAKASMLKAVEKEPENAYFNYALGVLQLQWREKDAAIPRLQKYTSLRPDDPRGHLALGVAYYSVLQFAAAQNELAPLAQNVEFRAAAELLLGRIASKQNEWSAAAMHLQRAVQFDANSADAQAELGAAYLKLDRIQEADQATGSALRLDPNNYTANLNLLRLYRDRKDARAEQQSERLKQLVEKQDADFRLLQRSVEFRPL